jgi:hypothetical protein
MEAPQTQAVQCSACGAPAKVTARHLAVATCTGCDRVLDLARLPGQASPLPASRVSAARVPMPLTARKVDRPGDWHLEVPDGVAGARWMKILGACVAFPTLGMALAPDIPSEMRLASAVMAVLGGYTLLQGLLNRMRLSIRAGGVDALWGPWPWLDSGTRVSEVAKFEVVRKVHQIGERADERFEFGWSLWAQRKDGARAQLLEEFDDPFFPLWLKQQLEERLAAAPGELP